MKLFIIIFLSTLFVACNDLPKSTLRLAVASNLASTIKEISEEFEKQSDIRCELILASSGKLFSQISEGAPYDVFISADSSYLNKVKTKDSVRIFAHGKLAYWSKNEIDSSSNLNLEIQKLEGRKLMMANPQLAPFGKATIETLNCLMISDSLYNLILVENIAQCNSHIYAKTIDAAFTCSSLFYQNKSIEGFWMEVADSLYNPIEQGAVSISNDKASTDFIDFLNMEIAQKILVKNGYDINLFHPQ
jgi:molybdate transport system substrate-binding protein